MANKWRDLHIHRRAKLFILQLHIVFDFPFLYPNLPTDCYCIDELLLERRRGRVFFNTCMQRDVVVAQYYLVSLQGYLRVGLGFFFFGMACSFSVRLQAKCCYQLLEATKCLRSSTESKCASPLAS